MAIEFVRSRSWIPLCLLVLSVFSSGCLGGPDSLPSTEQACLTDDVPQYEGPAASEENTSYPAPPDRITEETVGEFAADFQETWVLNALLLRHERENETVLSEDIRSEYTSSSRGWNGYKVDVETDVSYQSSTGIAMGTRTVSYFLNESVVFRTSLGPDGRSKTVLVRCPDPSE